MHKSNRKDRWHLLSAAQHGNVTAAGANSDSVIMRRPRAFVEFCPEPQTQCACSPGTERHVIHNMQQLVRYPPMHSSTTTCSDCTSLYSLKAKDSHIDVPAVRWSVWCRAAETKIDKGIHAMLQVKGSSLGARCRI